jgi:outer membrane protein insertion porin family
MNLKVDVKEMATRSFSVGAGYSSVDSFIFMGEISQRNFMGRGQTLNFKGVLGAQTNRFSLGFKEPYLYDTRVSMGVDVYNWEREYTDYTKKSSGTAFEFGYPFWENLNLYAGIRIDNTELSDISEDASQIIKDSVDIQVTHSITLSGIYDSRNNYHLPTRGWNNTLSMEYAGGPLGGDSSFTKYYGVVSYYHPLIKEFVGHVRAGAGYITEGDDGKLPIYEKFFLGGIDSIRGYKYGNVSPIDPETDERIGGTYMAFSQFETIFPLIKDMGMHGVLFFDAGNVWDSGDDYESSDLKKSVGLGIRWISPMGPLRIEWGYNLDAQPGDETSNWEFRMGGAL